MRATLGVDAATVTIFALVYLTYGLWIFLIARDVVRTRREVSPPPTLAWILIALLAPFGSVVWVVYRRGLIRRAATPGEA